MNMPDMMKIPDKSALIVGFCVNAVSLFSDMSVGVDVITQTKIRFFADTIPKIR